MRALRDTMLHFFADNLQGIPVHAIRQDPDNPNSSLLEANALNVQFLDSNGAYVIDTYNVSIDVLNDVENTAVDWVEQIKRLLRQAYYTPLQDYTVTPPRAVGTMLMWKPNIRFRPVVGMPYSHFSCTLPVQYRFN